MLRRALPPVCLIAGGALYAAAFPPHDVSVCAFVALLPLLRVADRASRRGALAAGALYGAAFFALTVPWVVTAVRAYFTTGVLPALLFSAAICALFVSGYLALFALGARALLRRDPWLALVAVPALWVAGEWARATLWSGLPWELLGHSQWRWLALIQVAEWGGVYVLSYGIAAVNVGLYLALRTLATRAPARTLAASTLPLAAATCLLVGALAYGRVRIAQEAARAPGARATIAVVQGNTSGALGRIGVDRAALIYADLSRRVIADARPDLLLWPEYALADYPDDLPQLLPTLEALAAATRAGLVFGAPRLEASVAGKRAFNSAFLQPPTGSRTAYDKRHLVPFAEYRPAPLGEAAAAGDEPTFEAGIGPTVLASAIGRLGMLICYEVVFPELARARVRAGAEVLVNLSNDGWLDTAGLGAGAQHLSIAVFRAVETRRFLARAATSGISGFIDPVGRPFDTLQLGARGARAGVVETRSDITPYVHYGDAFAAACGVVALAALGLAQTPRRGGRRA